MNILVMCTGYPSKQNPYNCTWAHIRNRYYLSHGWSVEVLVVGSNEEYYIDNVKVIRHKDALHRLRNEVYDVVVSHSPNMRAHVPLLKRHFSGPIVFFMHGSESMSINNDYPKPYSFAKESIWKRIFRDIYDKAKFVVLRRFILSRGDSIYLIFVSEWMKGVFSKNILDVDYFGVNHSIINNSLGSRFLECAWRSPESPKADFVTLRRLDDSKYCIDLIVNSALSNPDKTYHIYGKGQYFKNYQKPDNISHYDFHINNDDVPALLNQYRCALMPTRCDAQGVMVCEMAAYGMPVITSDIEVSHEMLTGFGNVKLLGLNEFSDFIDFDALDFSCDLAFNRERFSRDATVGKEMARIKEFVGFKKS